MCQLSKRLPLTINRSNMGSIQSLCLNTFVRGQMMAVAQRTLPVPTTDPHWLLKCVLCRDYKNAAIKTSARLDQVRANQNRVISKVWVTCMTKKVGFKLSQFITPFHHPMLTTLTYSVNLPGTNWHTCEKIYPSSHWPGAQFWPT